MTIALIIAGWALCGFLAYGRTLAHFQREYLVDGDHRGKAWTQAVLGPGGLIVSLIMGRHGFMWRLPPRDGS